MVNSTVLAYNEHIITPHFSEAFDKVTGMSIDGQSVHVQRPNGSSFVISLFHNEVQEFIDGIRIPEHPKSVPLMKAEYVLLHPDAKPPYRKRPTDAGYDIYSINDGIVPARGSLNVYTGLAISVRRGYYYDIRGRSGLATKDTVIPFHGLLDATYTDAVFVLLLNFSDKDYHFKKHDRIAQIVFSEQIDAEFDERDEFSPEYNQRGTAGFGSSGK